MPDIFKWIFLIVIGYVLGNFQTGIIIGRLFGQVDIRQLGSNNAGTTNVLRTLGWGPSLLTFLGDAIKGFLGSLIGYFLCGTYGAYAGGIAVIIGHNWPAFYGLKGGKGIATSFGVILFVHPWVALTLLASQVLLVAITKYMSVASIINVLLFGFIVMAIRWADWIEICLAFVLSLLGTYSHKANIKRLLSGAENKLDFAKINKLSKKK